MAFEHIKKERQDKLDAEMKLKLKAEEERNAKQCRREEEKVILVRKGLPYIKKYEDIFRKISGDFADIIKQRLIDDRRKILGLFPISSVNTDYGPNVTVSFEYSKYQKEFFHGASLSCSFEDESTEVIMRFGVHCGNRNTSKIFVEHQSKIKLDDIEKTDIEKWLEVEYEKYYFKLKDKYPGRYE